MRPDATILVLNCGSSSVKAAWFRADAMLKLIGSGAVENVGSAQTRFWAKPTGEEPVRDEALEAVDHEGAIDLLLTHVETWESTEAVAAAATCIEAHQRDKLEKLCRYITRPAIANERLSINDRGQVIYRFKQPFRDGSTHVVFEPLDFIARLAALVPRPRLNLTRYHGVFAPNCKERERIVPKGKPRLEQPDKPLAPMTWMQRLKRVFAIDIETCPKCGGKLRVIACIEDPDVIAKILEHVRASEPAESTRSRAPPLATL
jgi:hypothetical protein